MSPEENEMRQLTLCFISLGSHSSCHSPHFQVFTPVDSRALMNCVPSFVLVK